MRNLICLFFICLMSLCFFNSCKPVQMTSNPNLTNAGVDSITGISSSTLTSTITGINISSPTINVTIKALEKSNSPLLVVQKLEVVLYRDESKSSIWMYLVLLFVFLNFIVLVIHLRRMK